MHDRNNFQRLTGRILIGFVVLACLVLGVVGLVLPVIPGLVFLALAVLLAARHVPWIDGRLRSHRRIGRHMHRADRFFRLRLTDKVCVAALFCVKALLDGLDHISASLAKRTSEPKAR